MQQRVCPSCFVFNSEILDPTTSVTAGEPAVEQRVIASDSKKHLDSLRLYSEHESHFKAVARNVSHFTNHPLMLKCKRWIRLSIIYIFVQIKMRRPS